MENKNKERVIEYESELKRSFDLVLREAEELYQGPGHDCEGKTTRFSGCTKVNRAASLKL